MKKTISLEASKELQDVMPEKTEYWIFQVYIDRWDCPEWPDVHDAEILPMNDYTMRNDCNTLVCKTLTLTEAIDMLPHEIQKDLYLERDMDLIEWLYYQLVIRKLSHMYQVTYKEYSYNSSHCKIWETLLEAVEEMLLYLHKEWLLTK